MAQIVKLVPVPTRQHQQKHKSASPGCSALLSRAGAESGTPEWAMTQAVTQHPSRCFAAQTATVLASYIRILATGMLYYCSRKQRVKRRDTICLLLNSLIRPYREPCWYQCAASGHARSVMSVAS